MGKKSSTEKGKAPVKAASSMSQSESQEQAASSTPKRELPKEKKGKGKAKSAAKKGPPSPPVDRLGAYRDGDYSHSIMQLRLTVKEWWKKVPTSHPFSASYHSNLFWFLCPPVHHCPKLVEVVARYYKPNTRQVCDREGKVLFSLYKESVQMAFALGHSRDRNCIVRRVILGE